MRVGLVILLLLSVTGAATAESGASARDRAKQSMATRSAAKSVLEEIDALASDRGVDEILLGEMMVEKMTADVQAHKATRGSHALCKAAVSNVRHHYFNAVLTNAVASAQTHSPLHIAASDVLEALGEKWSDLVDRKVSDFISDRYDVLFDKARERAVSIQRRTVDKGIGYPSSNDIDSALSGLKEKAKNPEKRLTHNHFQELSGWVNKFTYEDTQSVFDENGAYVEQLSGKVLGEISKQYNTQLAVLDKTLSAISGKTQFIRASDAQNRIETAIAEAIADSRQKHATGDTPLCDMFSIVSSEASSAAERMETDKYIAYINGLSSISITDEAIESALSADKPAHRTMRQGIDQLTTTFGEQLKQDVVSGYLSKLGNPSAEDQKHFGTLLNENANVLSQYNKRIRQLLESKCKPIRKKLADADYQKYFSRLTTEALNDQNLIAYIHDNRKQFPVKSLQGIAELLKQSQNRKLAKIKVPTGNLLEETELRVITLVNDALSQKRDALDEQIRIVNELDKQLQDQLKDDVAAGIALDKIEADWGDALENNWDEYRVAHPDSPPEIFKRTRELLSKTVRQFYEAVEQSQQSAVPSESTKKSDIDFVKESESSLQSGAGIEEEEPEQDATTGEGAAAEASAETQISKLSVRVEMPQSEADCLIVLDNSRLFRCDAKLITREGTELASARISPKRVEASSESIHASIKDAIETQLQRIKESNQEEPTLKLFVIIKSDDIRHKMSIMLMQKVRTQIAEWSRSNMPEGNPIKLYWSVGF